MFTERCHRLATRVFMVKKPTITRGIVIAMFISGISLLYLSYYVSNVNFHTIPKQLPQPTVKCMLSQSPNPGPRDHTTSASLRIDNKVLVLIETQFSLRGQEIISIIESNRIKYKVELAGKNLPSLTRMDKGKYGVIIFENLKSYLNMDKWNRQILDKYCRDYNVGIISYASSTEQGLINSEVAGFPLTIHSNLEMRDYELNPDSDILRITKAGGVINNVLPGEDWTVFQPNHSTYEPLAFAYTQSAEFALHDVEGVDIEKIKYITAIQDKGLFDGIQRVFFGNGFKFWLHRPLFMDALSYLSHGKFSVPLDRYILIDIDDIFVGSKGIRLHPEDVQAMIDAQSRLQNDIKGFHFNLGFSGGYFHKGNEMENAGDDALLRARHHFWWFPHMWHHTQPHSIINTTYLENQMIKNYNFAKENKITVNLSYSVAPHHSGVYPIHEQLYLAWKRVWGIRVTSTEEYPHLKPARRRRGFIHRGIMVLPRQTCGLFTRNLFIDQYPGGRDKLDYSIRGGELFQTFLYNPISIFMTHMSNYGNDRLALYTFESAIKFLRCWTNLRLYTVPPMELGERYFNMFPEEESAIWRNPCQDKRHLEIWQAKKSCDKLPDFLVIGPQKTGTTALYTFLSLHPNIKSNKKSITTFEEVQFFNGRNYQNGLDWYMDFFPDRKNSSTLKLFEKSATYFDSDDAPKRAHAMLPNAKLITILIDPAKRAYSWYQHMKAHGDSIALGYSFHDVVTANADSPRALNNLRNRCLEPGLYASHLERWLSYYTDDKVLILDGEELKTDPISVMDRVQLFLEIQPYVDFNDKIKFNEKKGFFCQVTNGENTKCLGKSKGRDYPPMEHRTEKVLRSYYRRHNVALSKLLESLNMSVPRWLKDELREQE